MPEPFFNYIITIHNKEDMIRDVLLSTLLCCGPQSTIFAVLDGCTDRSEAILDEFTEQFQHVPLVKVYAPDVHELLSINIGLRAAPQEGEGYNIILQDDVILADLELESKIKQLYTWGNGRLGYVSLRLGANFEADALENKSAVPLKDYIETAYGHGLPEAEVLLPGRFAYRSVPIKSPVCLPTKLVREIGLLNEDLAPYAHDDTDLAIRLIDAGYFNGVFALRFYSEAKWGGTRVNPHPEIPTIQSRNMDKIRESLGAPLQKIAQGAQRSDVITFPELCSNELDKHALIHYEKAKQEFAEAFTFGSKVRNRLRRAIAIFHKAK
ncbi:MAG: hypothetical protein P4L10_12060 [Acidobacteriaceae bacterium]|nr:hypothetical protein [Acidobacteriaceae bacterium]